MAARLGDLGPEIAFVLAFHNALWPVPILLTRHDLLKLVEVVVAEEGFGYDDLAHTARCRSFLRCALVWYCRSIVISLHNWANIVYRSGQAVVYEVSAVVHGDSREKQDVVALLCQVY